MTEGLLIIGSWYSRCGGCGKYCDPYEKRHETQLPGYSREAARAGCGMVYTHVTTNYVAPGLTERIRQMRPDLEYQGAAEQGTWFQGGSL